MREGRKTPKEEMQEGKEETRDTEILKNESEQRRNIKKKGARERW